MIGNRIPDAGGEETKLFLVLLLLVVPVVMKSRSERGFRTRIDEQERIVDAVVIDTPLEGRRRRRPNGSRSSKGNHLDALHFLQRQLLGRETRHQGSLGVT